MFELYKSMYGCHRMDAWIRKTGESLFQRATLGDLVLKSHRISKLEVLLLKQIQGISKVDTSSWTVDRPSQSKVAQWASTLVG